MRTHIVVHISAGHIVLVYTSTHMLARAHTPRRSRKRVHVYSLVSAPAPAPPAGTDWRDHRHGCASKCFCLWARVEHVYVHARMRACQPVGVRGREWLNLVRMGARARGGARGYPLVRALVRAWVRAGARARVRVRVGP
eukprot:2243906-Pleurochrysis_carterae.AAC.8